MNVVCVDEWFILLTPLISVGLFAHEVTNGVVPLAILGRVTVNVVLVNGQNSVLSFGEILCACNAMQMIKEDITSVNIFFMNMCFTFPNGFENQHLSEILFFFLFDNLLHLQNLNCNQGETLYQHCC